MLLLWNDKQKQQNKQVYIYVVNIQSLYNYYMGIFNKVINIKYILYKLYYILYFTILYIIYIIL